MSMLNKRAIIGAVAVAVVATSVVIIVLRPKHNLENLSVVNLYKALGGGLKDF